MKLKEFFVPPTQPKQPNQQEPKVTSQNANSQSQEQTQQPQKIVKPSVTLIEWEAPDRPFKKRSRDFYRRIAIILIFFSVLFLIIKDFWLILFFGIFFFVVYVFTSIPPRKVVHKITTNGVYYASEHNYPWDQLLDFFFVKKDDTDFLVFDTVEKFPGRLYLILSEDVDKKKLQEIVNEYVSIIEEPETTYLDRMTSYLANKFKFN